MEVNKINSLNDLQPALPLGWLLTLLLLIAIGTLTAAVALPTWFPPLSQSLFGDKPKAYWYLSRASAFAAFGLIWLSMVFGLLITNRLARLWPGGPTAFDLHQYASLLGFGVALFHALILMGDRFIDYSLLQILVPFGSAQYRQAWVGLGQISFYGLALVSITFYMRRIITQRGFRIIHYLSYAAFILAVVHGLWSGTDGVAPWAHAIYWFCGGSTLFLTMYRILGKRVIVRAFP